MKLSNIFGKKTVKATTSAKVEKLDKKNLNNVVGGGAAVPVTPTTNAPGRNGTMGDYLTS